MNQTTLLAKLVERGPVRYTPAGVPACDFSLKHESELLEAGQLRKISMDIRAVAFGSIVQRLVCVEASQCSLYTGFLTNQRNGRGIVFHVTQLA
jgi:primosomal replication protein N